MRESLKNFMLKEGIEHFLSWEEFVYKSAWNAALEKAAQVAYTQLSLGRITRPENIRALKEE